MTKTSGWALIPVTLGMILFPLGACDSQEPTDSIHVDRGVRAMLVGRVMRQNGEPVPNALITGRIFEEANTCETIETIGGEWAETDDAGDYITSLGIALTAPFTACLGVEAIPPRREYSCPRYHHRAHGRFPVRHG